MPLSTACVNLCGLSKKCATFTLKGKVMNKTEILIALILIILCAFCAISIVTNKPEAVEIGYDEVEMNVSAYCPCSKCCGNFADGITASGAIATGKLIAAPPCYPFGTIMDVPGYGEAVVEDRGGAIQGDKIDLLFPTHQEALNWGRQYLTVRVERRR